MENYNVIQSEKASNKNLHGNYGLNKVRLNFDISSYHFDDIDLAMAVKKLNKKDQKVIVLHLMGYKHDDIANLLNLTRTSITKRLVVIIKNLALLMG